MPYSIPAIITAVEAGATLVAIEMVLVDIIVMAALMAAEKMLMPKMHGAGSSVQFPSQQMLRNSVANRNRVYGEVPVGGVMVYVQQSGAMNRYLDLVLVHASHEIDSYVEYHMDNYVLTLDGSGICTAETDVSTGVVTNRFAGLVQVFSHLGTAGDAADADLIVNSGGAWTSDHKLSGCAYTYWRLQYNQNAFAGGIPNISVVVRGKKLFDPRDSSTAWSDNAALVVLDYMMDPTYGFRAPLAEFDSSYLTTAVNDCDDDISLAGGGTEKRYTINCVIDTGTSPGQVLDTMLGAMAGMCPWVGGYFYMRAGTYQVPTVTLIESDLRKNPTLSTKLSMRDTVNGAKGTFLDPNSQWQASDFPQYSNSTYLADDNNVRYWLDLTLPLTTSPARAQRLAKIAVERTRAGQVVLKMPCKLTALRTQCGDNVMVTLDDFGYVNQVFEVVGFEFVTENDDKGVPGIGIDLTLRGTAAEAFDWASGEENPYEPSPASTLPNPFVVVNPTGLTLLSDATTVTVAADGTVIPRLKVSWTAPVDSFVISGGRIQIQYKLHGASTWLDWGYVGGDQTQDFITNVVSGAQYDVRVRSINSLPLANPNWVSSTSGTAIAGAPAAPGDVTGLAGVNLPLGVQFLWNNPTDANFGYTKLFISTVNDFSTAAVWFVGLATETKVPNLASGVVIYAWAKPFNTSGQGGNVTSVASAAAQDAVPDGAVTDPKIPDSTIDSHHIVPNAATNGAGSSVGLQSFLKDGAQHSVVSVVLTTSGQQCFVIGQININSPRECELYIDGSQVVAMNGGNFAFFTAQPVAGSHTFLLRYTATSGAGSENILNAAIYVIETKR